MLIHTHNYQNEYTILQNIRDLILQKIYKYSIHSLKKNNIIIYQLEDGKTKIDVKLEDETVWLSQQQMADLYGTTKQNISSHIKNIFDEEELSENSTVKEFLTVQKEENRNVNIVHKIPFYLIAYVRKI